MRSPNVVFILADDLGYGDVSCLNPTRGKIPTPNIDRLAKQGMIFTDGHSGSSVCSPTRYGLLTGRYCWRTMKSGVVPPYGSPLISRERMTLPRFLQEHGYDTACFGKWHLGWSWPKDGKNIRFDRPIADGPTTRGFDQYFGVDAPNWPPFCYIRNDRTVGIPTVHWDKPKEPNNTNSLPGLALPGWKLEDILPTLTDKVCSYISDRGRDSEPFFLYFPLTSPHTPLAVNEPWLGKSGLNRYADFVMETDAMVGRVIDAIDQSGQADNTIIVFASDNGCAPYIGVGDLEKRGHYPSGGFRGYKSDVWDGGHRVPLLVRWPGVVVPGSTCDQLTCLTDWMSTIADILGTRLPEDAAEDSVSILPLLRGGRAAVRESVINHSINGRFAVRTKRWKLVLCAGSGGWTLPDARAKEQGLPDVQLYDMSDDSGEQANLHDRYPMLVARLRKMLDDYAAKGRSTPGQPQHNDIDVAII